MTVPVFVVTGFLDSGKTTFINKLLSRQDWQDISIVIIQFESGEQILEDRQAGSSLTFPIRTLRQDPRAVAQQIHQEVLIVEPDEIWIEWNGMAPMADLLDLLQQGDLAQLVTIKRVLHIADAASFSSLLGRTGNALAEQVASSDCALVRQAPDQDRKTRSLLRQINPGLPVINIRDLHKLYRNLFQEKTQPINVFFLTLIFSAALFLMVRPVLIWQSVPIDLFVNLSIGILLQAMPFLLIGVLLSSAIQVFVPKNWIERRFPSSPVLGMVVAVLGGFCLPVCDCASIPVFRSLVRKGVPLPVAITFMTASPVINPVVLLSTYYAFGGQISVVLARTGLGLAAAVLIGLSFAVRPPSPGLTGVTADRLLCSCGCLIDLDGAPTFTARFTRYLRHAQSEFFHVGKFLLIGTFISVLFQTLFRQINMAASNGMPAVASILFMMVLAFTLSLCSSSDAVVARSFVGLFPIGALLAFMVFGPMADIKNVLLLSAGFDKRFIVRLLITTFGVCLLLILLYSGIMGG